MSAEYLTSDLLGPVRHGFFTRRGGTSSGLYDSLNCGGGSSDDAGAVAANRASVAAGMGVGPDRLQGMNQVHSADVAVIDEATAGGKPRADAIVTATPGIVLSVLTADCQPVLFADVEAGVIGAAHAGWRGSLGGVLEATLEAMEGLGADRAHIRAAIGPTISQRAYEVGPEFFEDFLSEDSGNDRFFAGGEGDRMMFDLPSYGLYRLREAGVGQAEWIRHCTYSDPDRFFSYRRSCHERQPDYGRLISAIRL